MRTPHVKSGWGRMAPPGATRHVPTQDRSGLLRRSRRPGRSAHRLAAAASCVAVALLAQSAAAGVSVALVPSATQVGLNTDFTVVLRVTQAGSLFDSYAALVRYDPGVLTFVQEPAATQEGAYMRNACGSTFHFFNANGPQIAIEHAIVCGGMALAGPGDLYVLHFRSRSTSIVASVEFSSIAFYKAGLTVEVTSATGAAITIGSPTDAVGESVTSSPARFLALPNPFAQHTVLFLPAHAQGAVLVHDARGRLVRRLEVHCTGSDCRTGWDGCDDRGLPLANGVYWATVSASGRQGSKRLVLAR